MKTQTEETKDAGDIVETENKTQEKASNLSACYNIVCLTAGSGTIFLPSAIDKGGYICILLIPLCAIICTYTSKLLIDCLCYKTGTRLKGYSDIGLHSFGKPGWIICQVTNLALLLCIALVFIFLTIDNAVDLSKNIKIGEKENHKRNLIFMYSYICSLIIVIPYLVVKKIKETTYLSFLGLLFTFAVVVIVSIASLTNIFDPSYKSPKYNLFDLYGFLPSLATISFSFGGIPVYPHIESGMKKPQDWTKVFSYSMAIVSIMYMLISVSGYFVYGNNVKLKIYDNLDEVYKIISKILITIHIVLTIPMVLCSFSLEVEKNIGIIVEKLGERRELINRTIFRFVTVLISATIIAFGYEHFKILFSITLVLNCLATFIIPVCCNLKLFGFRSKSYLHLAFMVLVLIIGFLTCIFQMLDLNSDKKSISF